MEWGPNDMEQRLFLSHLALIDLKSENEEKAIGFTVNNGLSYFMFCNEFGMHG